MTIGATLRASGTTPPVLTLSGTTTQVLGIRVECTTLGVRGVWVLRYSLDNGSTWTSNVLSAATIALGASGVTLGIASGTAAVDNVWQATSSAWANQGSAGSTFTQVAAASQALIVASNINAKPGLRFDGSASFMTGPLHSALITATDGAYYFALRPISIIRDNAGAPYTNDGIFGEGSASLGLSLRASTVAANGYNGASINTTGNVSVVIGTPVILGWRHTGGILSVFSNGNAAATIASGNTTLTAAMTIGLARLSPSFGNIDLCEVVGVNSIVAGDETNIVAYLRTRYGI